ncbi:MAG: hypothetical protein HOO88_07970 [Kiritimatiellaceae bacterium]|nr:hypothetical protein [Kiritimatiellaceae bacterium]
MKKILLQAVLFAVLSITSFAAEPETPFTALPMSGQSITFLKNQKNYMDLTLFSWGPGWRWLPLKGTAAKEQTSMVARNTGSIDGTKVAVTAKATQVGPNQLKLEYDLSAEKSTKLSVMVLGIKLDAQPFTGGKILIKTAEGTESVIELKSDKLGKGSLGKQVKECILIDAAGLQTKLSLDPASDMDTDGLARIVLVKNELAKPVAQTVTVTMPAALTFYAAMEDVPDNSGISSWYVFNPTSTPNAGEIGLQDWLEKPAGRHGRITRDGENMMYNGKPIKLWGINNCYADCKPDKATAERRAAFYAKYGINAVRLHKYADGDGWQGIRSKDSCVIFDPAGLDAMDYLVAKFKEQGIYVEFSANFGSINPSPADCARIPYIDEFDTTKKGDVKSGGGSAFLSRELQDLHIEQVVNLLKHKNPYTGNTYATEPSVAVIELLNEESILFFGTASVLKKSPTLRKRTSEAFCDWLQKRYGSEEKLIEAWGPNALNWFASFGIEGESWKDKTIVPFGNPWFYEPAQLDGQQKPVKVRLLDTMLFLYELQNDFYNRFVKAIRDTGYEGEILASNWQAGRGFSHYYNLHSDTLVGMIDRHNYFGGDKSRGKVVKINNASMLAASGGGMLSAGLQQVGNRPFMLSEWVHVSPNEWRVEGPALIGAYGMGLQDWDISFIFENGDKGTFSSALSGKPQSWEVAIPQILGVFPAVSRQVLRGDVKKSDLTIVRNVSIPSLQKGLLDYDDEVVQDGDEKTFTGKKIPAQALAVGRCVVNFTDTYMDTPTFDLTPYRQNGGIRSANGQLFWKEGQNKMDGYFTINAAATKAVVGFAKGETCVLGDVTIQPESRYGAIYVSAQEKDKDIATAGKVLVTAIARARNTGMQIASDSILSAPGKAPILMEPVKARITMKRTPSKVQLLDHDGVTASGSLPVEKGSFEIDGARDKTCYYLVTFD